MTLSLLTGVVQAYALVSISFVAKDFGATHRASMHYILELFEEACQGTAGAATVRQTCKSILTVMKISKLFELD
jgi:hypothetical protein